MNRYTLEKTFDVIVGIGLVAFTLWLGYGIFTDIVVSN